MLRAATSALVSALLLSLLGGPVFATRVTGEVTRVENRDIAASFPVPVRTGSMMMVLAGDGDAIAGAAIVQRCEGSSPPYAVSAGLLFATDSVGLRAGSKAYVDSVNTSPAPSSLIRRPSGVHPRTLPRAGDLGAYYYAASQTVGYGAFGLGCEQTLRFTPTMAVVADVGATGVGIMKDGKRNAISIEQYVTSANTRLQLDFVPEVALYSGLRWSLARGNSEQWKTISSRLGDETFSAPSSIKAGWVETRGIEYGATIRPAPDLALSAGYIPSLRVDYGSLGVRGQPAYTGEMRVAFWDLILRMRGVATDKYWMADLGITIR